MGPDLALYGKPLPVCGDGKQIRDWLYVDGHNLGVDLILKKAISGGTNNFGGNNEWKNILNKSYLNWINKNYK